MTSGTRSLREPASQHQEWLANSPTAAVEAMASDAFGAPLEVRCWTGLNCGGRARVARAGLAGPAGAALSVVAKYLSAEGGPALRERFRAELFAYRFLMRARDRFSSFPRLLGWGEGIVLLEDLGVDAYAFATTDEATRAVASVLADLHRSTAARYAEHNALRVAWGYVPDDRDPRPWGLPFTFAAFARGQHEIRRFAGILIPHCAAPLAALLADVERIARLPGPFHAFVHDDLASRRQTVVQDRRFLLLDFEHAKYFHCLIDLAKVMVGKIESRDDGCRVHVHSPGMEALVRHYRDAWVRAGGPDLPDAVWDRNLVAMLTFQAMLAIAQVVNFADRAFAASATLTIRSILRRLVHHLGCHSGGEDLAEIFDRIQERILA